MAMRNHLRKLVVKELSLVPRGAAPGAHVLIRKEDEAHMSLKQRVLKALEEIGLPITKTDLEEVPGEQPASANPPAEEAPVTDVEKQAYDKKLADLEAKLALVEKGENERVAKAEADAEAAREAVAKMEAEKDLVVAKELLGQAPGEPATLATVLKQLDDAGREFLTTLLTRHNTVLKESGLFESRGTNEDPAPLTLEQKVEKAVSEVRKEDTSLTHEQAVAEAMRRDPALYSAFLPK